MRSRSRGEYSPKKHSQPQEKVQDFQSAIADYLRSTDKAELSPAGIKRDVELLLNDPRAGAESLKERPSIFLGDLNDIPEHNLYLNPEQSLK